MVKFADWHCDTASKIFEKNENLINAEGHMNIELLESFDAPVQMFAVWLRKELYPQAFDKTVEIIDYFKKEIEVNKEKINLCTSYDDVINNGSKISAMLAIEGGEAIEGSIEKLHRLYKLGVRLVTLTWNYKNCIATGVMESSLGGGLSEFGKLAVKEMEKLGIIVDVSHLSDEGFYDVVRHTEKPFIASHSNCRKLCSFPRNLTDDQLKIIGDRGGIVGLNMCTAFLNDCDKAGMGDILRHIEHMLKTCGEDSICFGCDFDGISKTPIGMENVSGMESLIGLIDDEFGKEIAKKIAYINYFRVLQTLI